MISAQRSDNFQKQVQVEADRIKRWSAQGSLVSYERVSLRKLAIRRRFISSLHSVSYSGHTLGQRLVLETVRIGELKAATGSDC